MRVTAFYAVPGIREVPRLLLEIVELCIHITSASFANNTV